MALDGGKHYLAKKIVGLMPPRGSYISYVEPYAGGLSVLLANDPDGISEVVNDIDGRLTNFWHVIANRACFEIFARAVQAIPFSEREYEECADENNFRYCSVPRVDDAVKFFVRNRQSLAGRMAGFTGITKTRTRRGMNNEVSAWLNCVEGLPAVHERLKRVLILNRPAIEVITSQDNENALFYCDPPYAHETRVTTTEYGDNEMSANDHAVLLETLGNISGKFMLSGYVC